MAAQDCEMPKNAVSDCHLWVFLQDSLSPAFIFGRAQRQTLAVHARKRTHHEGGCVREKLHCIENLLGLLRKLDGKLVELTEREDMRLTVLYAGRKLLALRETLYASIA